jgi:hypothetical protein
MGQSIGFDKSIAARAHESAGKMFGSFAVRDADHLQVSQTRIFPHNLRRRHPTSRRCLRILGCLRPQTSQDHRGPKAIHRLSLQVRPGAPFRSRFAFTDLSPHRQHPATQAQAKKDNKSHKQKCLMCPDSAASPQTLATPEQSTVEAFVTLPRNVPYHEASARRRVRKTHRARRDSNPGCSTPWVVNRTKPNRTAIPTNCPRCWSPSLPCSRLR